MSLNKQAFIRYQVIDSQLYNNEYVKTSELEKAMINVGLTVSKKTINNDLNDMRDDTSLGYLAPIGYCKSRKAYYYTDPDFTIKAIGLKDADISALQFFANSLGEYKGYEVFKDFTGAIDKILDAVTIRKGISSPEQARTIVQTEIAPAYTGSNWISKIVEALNTNVFVEFAYQKFDDEIEKTVKLQPYLLKEHHHLWYVIGMDHRGRIVTYALDRIKTLLLSESKFIPCIFDFENYFYHSFGVTVTNDKPLIVVLSFIPIQGKYIKALPIHPTQKILIDSEVETRISVEVKPSYEFYEKILGYGKNVLVVSPPKIVKEVRERLCEATQRYTNK